MPLAAFAIALKPACALRSHPSTDGCAQWDAAPAMSRPAATAAAAISLVVDGICLMSITLVCGNGPTGDVGIRQEIAVGAGIVVGPFFGVVRPAGGPGRVAW